jgi:hypothetical protein
MPARDALKSVLPWMGAGVLAVVGNASAGELTIDTVIRDMSLPSEAPVIDPKYDWQRKPRITQYAPSGTILPSWWSGMRPQWCYKVLSWYTAYEAQGNAATNTRVQLRHLRIYVLSNRTRRWGLVDAVNRPHTDLWRYPFNYAGGTYVSGARQEAGGGHSVKPYYPNFHHGYGKVRSIEHPSDVRAVFIAMDFRLVVDDPEKADDRTTARYVIDVGADYYPGEGMSWGMDYAPGVGNGRYLLATKQWRTASLLVPNKRLNATFAEIRTNPPPLN